MKRMLMIVVMVATTALALPALAQPRGPEGGGPGGPGGGGGELGMPHGAWWQRAAVVKQIGLTEEQQQKIQRAFLEHRKKMIRLRGEIEIQELELEPLLSAKKLDAGKLAKVIDAVEKLRSKMSRERMEMLLTIRKTISAEQYEKLKGLRGRRGSRQRRPEGEGGNDRRGGRRGRLQRPGGARSARAG